MVTSSLTCPEIFLSIILDISTTIIFCNHYISFYFFAELCILVLTSLLVHSSFFLSMCFKDFHSSVHLMYTVSLPFWDYQKPLLHHQNKLGICYASYTRASNKTSSALTDFRSCCNFCLCELVQVLHRT